MRPPPEQMPPLFYGPDEVTEGYYELEALERNAKLNALKTHQAAVVLWYRALTLYRQGMMGTWEYPGDEGPGIGMTVWGLQGQLLGLGISSAKAALDLLLAGYYSAAYATIRHMIESLVQCLYVHAKPEEARRWYQESDEAATLLDPPRCQRMIARIKAHPDFKGRAWFFDDAYEAWQLMSKGAHPSGEGITQTVDEESGQHVFGATYNRGLCLTGFDHGLFAVLMLVQSLSFVRSQAGEWTSKVEALHADVRQWRESMASSFSSEHTPP